MVIVRFVTLLLNVQILDQFKSDFFLLLSLLFTFPYTLLLSCLALPATRQKIYTLVKDSNIETESRRVY